MKQLDFYIMRAALGPFLFVTMVLTGVVWIVIALRFVDEIVNYDMTTGAFLFVSLMLLPQLLPVTLPVGLFCGLVYAYWRLSMGSELVVMRASGVSLMALARPGVALACLAAVGIACATFYLTPQSNSAMRDERFAWRYLYSSMVLREGAFTPLKNGLTVYVAERRPGGQLYGLLLHDERRKGRQVTMMAERGAMVRDEKGPAILLHNGNRQERDIESGNVDLLFFDRYDVEINLLGEQTPIRRQKIEEYGVLTLFGIDDPNLSADEIWRHRAEGHKRIAMPLLAIVLALIAIATVLSGEFDRRGATMRLWIGGLAAGLMQAAVMGLLQAAINQPWLIAMTYALIAGGGGLCLYTIRAGGVRRAPRMVGAVAT